MSIARKDITKLPDTPGVYFFKDGKKILYIGKATSLRDRVRSYLSSDIAETRGPLIVKMMEEATSVRVEQTDSVLEALILEASLIRKYKPRYNVREKDDRSFNYVCISKDAFPIVSIVRGRTLHENEKKYRAVFGPFPNAGQLREALRIIRKIFPWRDEKCHVGSEKPCFNYQIGLCPGTCVGAVSEQEYARTIRHIILFFNGKKKELVQSIERDMCASAKAQRFEEAGKLKRQLFALQHIQDVALIKHQATNTERRTTMRIEAYDVAHISETSRVGVMVVVEDGEAQKGEYRKFKIRSASAGDTNALEEILERRLSHAEWPLPQLIVIDGGKAQLNSAERILKRKGFSIELVAVVKDEHHRPKDLIGKQGFVRQHETEILLANSEAHRFAISYHKMLRSKRLLGR